jgi:oligoribonuclease NrnB/cAMP/cGMP phosphodiesterase (DHH superfamily)
VVNERNGIDPVTEEDKQMIESEYERVAEYIRQCDKNLIRIDLNGHKVGVSISEQYRSSVGNELSKKYQDELDYILIINFMRNQFSFRTVRDDVNVGLLAKSFTKEGGGHYKDAGMPINTDTIFILVLVIESMLNIESSKLTRNV